MWTDQLRLISFGHNAPPNTGKKRASKISILKSSNYKNKVIAAEIGVESYDTPALLGSVSKALLPPLTVPYKEESNAPRIEERSLRQPREAKC